LPPQNDRLGSHYVPHGLGLPPRSEHFIRGTLYLHSFEYELAAQEFQVGSSALAPGFAMAYWGEAMTYNHPVWDQQDKPAALAALNRLAATPARRVRRRRPRRGRRRGFHAVEVLYGAGSKEKRDTLYSTEMERIAASAPARRRSPDLLRSVSARAEPGYSRRAHLHAGGQGSRWAVLKRSPDHPGCRPLRHSRIRRSDPRHLGLDAARAYAGIAPGAAHAQHMTTHIFLALGKWDEVVKQNIVASGPIRRNGCRDIFTSWLEYGLLQQGRFDDASHLLGLMARNLSDTAPLSRRGTLC
jgi:hypothetical protein